MATQTRVPVRGRGWTRTTTIDADKFERVSAALLEVLTSEPVTFTALVHAVAKRLPGFDGSVAWYALTCARELEVQGRVVRQARPVRYLKAASPPGSSAGRGRTR